MSSKEESTSSRPYETPAQKAAKSVFLLTSFAVIIYASMVNDRSRKPCCHVTLSIRRLSILFVR
eukprot:1110120-Rhodomonas_salina.2